MTDQRSPLDYYDPIEVEAPAAAGPPPPSLGDVFSAGRRLARGDRIDASTQREAEGYRPIIEALGLSQRDNPASWYSNTQPQPSSYDRSPSIMKPGLTRVQHRIAIFADIAERRRTNPNFLPGIPDSPEAFEQMLIENERKARATARETLGRAEGVTGWAAGFAGGALETTLDPVNMAMLPIGGGGRTLAQIVAREAIVGMVTEGVQQPFVARGRAELGEEFTLGDAATNVAMGGVGGGALGGAAEVIGRGIARAAPVAGEALRAGTERVAAAAYDALPDGALAALARRYGGDTLSGDERAAVNVLERQAEIDATNPFRAGTTAGDMHASRLTVAMGQLLDARAAPQPVAAPRYAADPDRMIGTIIDDLEGGARAVTDTGGLTRFGISSRANPDVNVAGLDRATAIGLYRQRYWAPMKLDGMDPAMQMVALDTAVNHGVGRAKRLVAEANGSPQRLLALRRAEYTRLIAENPGRYGRFERGWENRLRKVEAEIGMSGAADMPVLNRALFDDDLTWRMAQAELTAELSALQRAADAEAEASAPQIDGFDAPEPIAVEPADIPEIEAARSDDDAVPMPAVDLPADLGGDLIGPAVARDRSPVEATVPADAVNDVLIGPLFVRERGNPGYSIERASDGTLAQVVWRDPDGVARGSASVPLTDEAVETMGGLGVYVDPAFRRRGIATGLYDYGARNGLPTMELAGRGDLTPDGAAFNNALRARPEPAPVPDAAGPVPAVVEAAGPPARVADGAFDDPDGPDAQMQIDSILHDLMAAEVDGTFRLSAEGEGQTLADMLADIEADEAAIQRLMACMTPKAIA